MEEAVAKFQSVVKSNQRAGAPHQNDPMSENKNLPIFQQRDRGSTNTPIYRKELKSSP